MKLKSEKQISVIPTNTGLEIEQIIAKAYNEFYEQNKELFKKDAIEYWRQAHIYKENKVRQYKIQNLFICANSHNKRVIE